MNCCRATLTARPNGFTLLEILVALAVLGLLMAGLVQGLQVGIATWERQSRTLAERGDLESADRTLRALLARMDPGGVSGRPPTFKGTPRGLIFTATPPAASDVLENRDTDVTFGVDATHRLELVWRPRELNRNGPAPPVLRVVLLRDVARLDMAYWREPRDGWQSDWRGPSLPKLIRIRIVFVPGDGLHASDIVVAPMRDRWRL